MAGWWRRCRRRLRPPVVPASMGRALRGSGALRHGSMVVQLRRRRRPRRRCGCCSGCGRGPCACTGVAARLLQLPFLRIRPFRGCSCCRPCGSGRNSPVRAAVEGRGGVTSRLPVLFVLDVGEHRRKPCRICRQDDGDAFGRRLPPWRRCHGVFPLRPTAEVRRLCIGTVADSGLLG